MADDALASIRTDGSTDLQAPTAFPEPGTYAVAQSITLLCATPGVTIRYTLDGTPPTSASPVFDAYALIPMQRFGDPVVAGRRAFVIRAAAQAGDRFGPEATFEYVLDPRPKDVYVSAEIAPGVHMIRDFDDDKMYLITGGRRALLIDTGMGGGDLRGYVEALTHGLPLDVIITHGHPDHIARMGQFQADCNVYLPHADLPLVELFIGQFGYDIDLERIQDLREGDVFDLGDRSFRAYCVPGHSPGCMALLDEGNRLLIAGDAVGSNRPTIVDALWMQFSDDTIDRYLSALQVFRDKIAGKFDVTYGGHNDQAIRGERYLDHLEEAAQRLVDLGEAALTPSPRPHGVWQTVSGDRLTDPDWAAINVAREKCLSAAPDKIATLSNLRVVGGSLTPGFTPTTLEYTVRVDPGRADLAVTPIATSRRSAGVRVNGAPCARGAVCAVPVGPGADRFTIEVDSPDGTITKRYTVTVGSAD